MTIRCGMSGDTVKSIQQLLSSLNLYTGPIDSLFGGGLESAVKNYQKRHGLKPSGLVDSATWMQLFPGQPVPVSPLAGQPLAGRCLALTGSFETGKFPPDCFCGLTGDFDGQGISFGALQWNIGQGTLQPLLKQTFEQHPAVAQSIFHEHLDTLQSLATASLPEQLAFTRSIQAKGRILEPWRGMLTALGRAPENWQIQTNHAAKSYRTALQLCTQFGLASERGVALMFDIITQNGSIRSIVRAQILADCASLPSGDAGSEVARMSSIANRVAASSNPKYRDDVRTRKLLIATGQGVVHGIAYDLAGDFSLTLNPYSTSSAA